MQIYSSQTHKRQSSSLSEPGKVRMYVCGPTVYDNIHIGNARTFISFDVIRRWLIASGYEVTFAQNRPTLMTRLSIEPTSRVAQPPRWPRNFRTSSSTSCVART